jgi:hypothetical protein
MLVSTEAATRSRAPRELPVEQLSTNVNIFIGQLGQIVDKAPSTLRSYDLEEISFTAEVTGKGELSLLGSGVSLEAKGGLTFTFKRNRAKALG